jgi:hypothetical protein
MSIRHRIFKLVAALLVLLSLTFGPASVAPASAATVYYYFRAAHSGLVLDVEGASTANGARIIQWPGFNTYPANQQWTFIAVPGTYDTYYIESGQSYKVLSVNSSAPGAPVIQWTNTGATSQQWVEVQVGAARKYRNVATGLYLDVSGYSYNAGARLVSGTRRVVSISSFT